MSPRPTTSRTFGNRSFWTGSEDDADPSPCHTKGSRHGDEEQSEGQEAQEQGRRAQAQEEAAEEDQEETPDLSPPRPAAWLVGPPGQNVMFCPHPEDMIGVACQPLDRVGALIPDVLPPEPTTVAPGCAGDCRLIFNFEGRSRAVYDDVCEMPAVLVPLYEAAWKVMTNVTQ